MAAFANKSDRKVQEPVLHIDNASPPGNNPPEIAKNEQLKFDGQGQQLVFTGPAGQAQGSGETNPAMTPPTNQDTTTQSLPHENGIKNAFPDNIDEQLNDYNLVMAVNDLQKEDEPNQLGSNRNHNWTTEDQRDVAADLDLKFPKAPIDPIEQDETAFQLIHEEASSVQRGYDTPGDLTRSGYGIVAEGSAESNYAATYVANAARRHSQVAQESRGLVTRAGARSGKPAASESTNRHMSRLGTTDFTDRKRESGTNIKANLEP